ncbi:CHAT domain-containing protein, partial [Actinoplanes sp. NPDC048791]|uniref:CHAT domain-containing protein n=1 Tax=Actinoplanes sp. NPDC048791 TaxID=3154623 RepID=UPI0033EDF661
DQPAAVAAFERLIGTAPAPVLSRALAAQQLGHLLARNGDAQGALAAFGTAVSLLDLVAWVGLGRDDQERLLAQFGGLASAAAACALSLGQPDTAVEVLEQGRGVLYAQALSLRSGGDVARERAPELTERLTALHALLDPAAPQEPGRVPWSRQEAAVARNRLIDQIREVDGTFLRPPGLAALRDLVGERCVAIVNVSPYRCDAILLTGGRTHVVPLTGLDLDDVRAHARSLLAEPAAALTGLLPWLWDTTVGPILDRMTELGLAPDGDTPSLWWLPTGPMSYLPLHAAALHRVVSSYTPTLRALDAGDTVPGGPAVVVAMPETAGHPALPRAVPESEAVRDILGPETIVVSRGEATRTRVAELLREASVVHFACHATTDHERPSDSHLVLADGRLRVRDLITLRPPAGGRTLAYLSACSTATTGARLPDENIHLASALRLAGFAGVVATLWPVPDIVAARATTATFGGLSTRTTPEAVHACARQLHDRYRQRPAMWAGLVHVGPGGTGMVRPLRG